MPAILLSDLQRAQTALQQHRRQQGRRRIPDSLRREVVDLLTSYPRRQIVTALDISYPMLSQWEQAFSSTGSSTGAIREPESFDFIRLPQAAESDVHTPYVVSALELRLSAEAAVSFKGAGAVTDCLSLLQGLGYGRQGVCA